jgi:aryl-alcohol dehydrogenase-like predicted oxidoreductase
MGRGTSRGHLLSALDASLRRLGTDHVDLWQLHAWDPVTPWEESLAAVDTAVQSGRVRLRRRLELLRLDARRHRDVAAGWPGRAPLVSNQVEYSCCSAASSARSCPPRRRSASGWLPWSPLGRGVLTGKYRNGAPADSRGASDHFAGFVEALPRRRRGSVVDAV